MLLIVIILFNVWLQENKLRENFKIVKGEVIKIETFRSSGKTIFLKFEFDNNNQKIISKASLPCEKNNKSSLERLLIGKNMDVVYEKTDASNCEMLLQESSYKKYNLAMPDELASLIDSIAVICSQIDD
jgi:hypothetical protein